MFEHCDLVPLILSYLDDEKRKSLCKKYFTAWVDPIPKIEKIFDLVDGNYMIDNGAVQIRLTSFNVQHTYIRDMRCIMTIMGTSYIFELHEYAKNRAPGRKIRQVIKLKNSYCILDNGEDSPDVIYTREICQ